jgi:hypothetical protein
MTATRTPVTTTTRTRSRRTRRVAFALLGAAGGLAVVTTVPSSAEARTTAGTCVATSHTTNWKAALTAADQALGRARTDLQHRHYVKATRHLRVMKRQALTANTAATRLIGKPPTDPESDDPPGVTAVLRVSGFDHTLTMALIPLFSDPRGHHVVAPLGKGLNTVVACRDRMLNRVIALKPGARDDYVDGLSDTVPVYAKELTALSTALAGDALTPAGRTALQRAQHVVTATDAAMERVFGGGERSAG